MSHPIARPDSKLFDGVLKRADWIVDRVSVGALVAAILVCSAKLPHCFAVVAVAFACVGLSAVLELVIKLGQRSGLVSVTLLNDKPKTHLFDDDDLPQPKIVPIARNVAQDDRLAAIAADEISKVHHLETHEATIAGRGKVTYWIAEG